MSTPYYLVAHHAVPTQAAENPSRLWITLSGPDWSTWLAMIGQTLGTPLRGVGVEGVLTGLAINIRDGIEMIAVYFPTPTAPGEPFYSVLARRPGTDGVRTFVFELGVPEPNSPQRVVMAEWRILTDNTLGDKGSKMRMRFDVEPDASLETCLRRTAAVMNEAPPSAQASNGGAPIALKPAKPGISFNLIFLGIVVGVCAIGALAIYLLGKL